MARLPLVALLAVAPACLWEHGKGGGTGDDVCVQAGTDTTGIALAPQRDPGDLRCVSFGGGGGCDPSCGPCPAAAFTPPIPSWGFCGSPCETKGPTECAADQTCRVVRNASCTVGGGDCLTDFLGCFATDQQVDASINCFMADAWSCSRNHACEAHHVPQGCGSASDCARPFSTCTPVGHDPGRCTGPVTCNAVAPTCPAGTTAGIANGCFTGACIVTSTCS